MHLDFRLNFPTNRPDSPFQMYLCSSVEYSRNASEGYKRVTRARVIGGLSDTSESSE